jgi:transcriptional regulator with XRE-family HTH domain
MPARPRSDAAIFGANVRRIRNRRRLTQEQLGWACGLHQTAIARIEEAERQPQLKTIMKLARGLDVRPAELFKGIR